MAPPAFSAAPLAAPPPPPAPRGGGWRPAFSAGLGGATAITLTPRTEPPASVSPRMPSQGAGATLAAGALVKNERIADTGAPTTTGAHVAAFATAWDGLPHAAQLASPVPGAAAPLQARTSTAATLPPA